MANYNAIAKKLQRIIKQHESKTSPPKIHILNQNEPIPETKGLAIILNLWTPDAKNGLPAQSE